jgi:hypothetical protein
MENNKIQKLTITDVIAVYSGACGRGGYPQTYCSENRKTGQRRRHSKVKDEEVNDAEVSRVLDIVKANAKDVGDLAGCLFMDLAEQRYAVYLL